jgi:2-methylcitrate dehydratase PrpD
MNQTFELGQAVIKQGASQILADFLAGVQYVDLPRAVILHVENSFLDWFGCALAGRGARPIRILEQFAATMGPPNGPSEILTSRKHTSPYFAALLNGAASHIVEMDDVHNGAALHPGVVVFPAVFAVAQQLEASGRELITAAVVGYEATIRVGEFLGPAHYKVFHTTGTAGTVGAAAGVGHLLGLNTQKMLHALGSAGTQAAGLWEFLTNAADSKPLHTAKAASDGLLSAYIARGGFTGAAHILEGRRGMAAGMSHGADPARLTDGLGKRWKIMECSFKAYACCRHTHPSADALLGLMQRHHLKADDIAHITAHVHHGAIDVLGAVTNPETVHQSKFSMGFVLGLIAHYGRAGIDEFDDHALSDPKVRAFLNRVEMVLDPEIDSAPGNLWGGRVEVETSDGRRLEGRIAFAKGDPENTLNRSELEAKALRLAAYRGAASQQEMERIVGGAWALHDAPNLRHFLLGT